MRERYKEQSLRSPHAIAPRDPARRRERHAAGHPRAVHESVRATFVQGERSWLRYRRQSCAAEASRFAGGTAHGVAFLTCTVQRNKAHVADLAAMRKTLAQP
jgi:uncharacterized protein YecT (DUF1311 family)